VILTAIVAGVGSAVVGVVVVEPLAQKLFSSEAKALMPK
jgi:hypothetical protein